MAPEDDGHDACQLLAKVAKGVFPIVMRCGIQQRERVAGEVGTRLGQIAQEPLQGYETDQEAEGAATSLLHTLLMICKFPDPVGRQTTAWECYSSILALLRPESKTKLNKSVLLYFKMGPGYSSQAKEQCDRFFARLSEEGPNKKTAADQIMGGTRMPEPSDYPRHVNENLFQILHRHSQSCGDHHLLSHPARLYLDGNPQIQSKHAQFELVVSTADMNYWQDLWVGVPMQTKTRKRLVGFNLGRDVSSDEDEEEGDEASGLDQVSPDYFCQILRDPSFAKLRVRFIQGLGLVSLRPPAALERFLCPGQGLPLCTAVESYKLKDKDKIILAHAIAHSFWQFYGSDLMQERWTSHNIWFMQETDEQQHPKDQLALRAYMSLDFNGQNSVDESMDNPMVTHPFPHILALAIVLLEIGLRRPFKSMDHLPLASRLNRDHGAANQLLNELEKSHWASSTQRDIFTRVVANCLDQRLFAIDPISKHKKTKSSGVAATSTRAGGGEFQVDERRRRIYAKVVEPLARLVNIAFKNDPKCISYLSRCREAEVTQQQLRPPVASFHAGKTIVAREWLDNLKHISRHIMLLRRQKPDHVFVPVKIAILDTGYDANLPFFCQTARAKCIRGWRDFVGDGHTDDTTRRDDYGHGSLMARLAMESAPLANIYIARVAKDSKGLSLGSRSIVEAIRWAGLEEEADVISMSFGFPDDDEDIAKAIEDVERERNVVFLASAGNNAAYQVESFPARHRSVISIRATNCDGTFSASNPPIIDRYSSSVLGTFGDDLPENIHKEITGRFGPSICQPGSSVATAVAAGIAASTIAFAEALSSVLPIPKEQSPVQSLKKSQGMMRMLEKMAPEQTGYHKFVNPIWFWSEKSDPWKAWAAMYDSVSQLMYRR
ncbi:hypothetical protein LCI18_008062 [Fusarium solani-melongenae]|uniref:Uncharacterized protein n=1 Tax=Fusarium solani subsp. cucurbitae TaxID=2747967 RepID=A0ACD3Z7E1_FUSSC|nr:hypothetical protein LCI18_008062 [Fusarium solani-melongenae]